jgi:hypothetical protein
MLPPCDRICFFRHAGLCRDFQDMPSLSARFADISAFVPFKSLCSLFTWTIAIYLMLHLVVIAEIFILISVIWPARGGNLCHLEVVYSLFFLTFMLILQLIVFSGVSSVFQSIRSDSINLLGEFNVIFYVFAATWCNIDKQTVVYLHSGQYINICLCLWLVSYYLN